ncbi:hypothetical protein [Photobacterium galatheae]|uniref:hypothetical protein n=1 Tax=Photobacterium galatheae TaxID=1654360 RepID=UPI00126966F3|nr:hypothetical protein [Photobacterium galatheae]
MLVVKVYVLVLLLRKYSRQIKRNIKITKRGELFVFCAVYVNWVFFQYFLFDAKQEKTRSRAKK